MPLTENVDPNDAIGRYVPTTHLLSGNGETRTDWHRVVNYITRPVVIIEGGGYRYLNDDGTIEVLAL